MQKYCVKVYIVKITYYVYRVNNNNIDIFKSLLDKLQILLTIIFIVVLSELILNIAFYNTNLRSIKR